MFRRLAALGLAFGLLLALAGPPAALADQGDPRLDGLFARLRATEDAGEAFRLRDRIWSMWLESGRPEIDLVMHEGRRFMRQGILHSALGNFGFVIKLAPGFAEGWNKRATVHYMMGNLAASMQDIRRTLSLEPRHFGALTVLGAILARLGRERAALEALERALEINPHLSVTRRNVDQLKKKLNGKKV